MRLAAIVGALLSTAALAQTCDYYPLNTCAQNVLGKKTFLDGISAASCSLFDGGNCGGTGSGSIDGGYVDLVSAQSNIKGNKTFAQNVGVDGGLIIGGATTLYGQADMQANSVIRGSLTFLSPSGGNFFQLANNAGLNFSGNVNAGAAGSDFQMSATNFRNPTDIIWQSCNDNGAYCSVSTSAEGDVKTGCTAQPDGGPGVCGSFTDNSASSGHVSLTCAPGFYPVAMGRLPSFADDAGHPYGGIHGDVDVISENFMDAGFLFQIQNQGGGPQTLFDMRAAMVRINEQTLSNFDTCGTGSVIIPGDQPYPGQHFYGEFETALRWASDKHGWYTCNTADPGDGGKVGWQPVLQAGSDTVSYKGTMTLSTGSKSVNVLPGSICVCTDTTANASVKCAPAPVAANGVLTATGTGSDVIAWICL